MADSKSQIDLVALVAFSKGEAQTPVKHSRAGSDKARRKGARAKGEGDLARIARHPVKSLKEACRSFRSAFTLAHRIAAAMVPGRWYARPDMVRLTGLKYGSIKGRTDTMVKDGTLERAQNPAWAPKQYQKGQAIHEALDGREPRWLYRLTPEGLALRRAAMMLA